MIKSLSSLRLPRHSIACFLLLTGFILGTAFRDYSPRFFVHTDAWLFNTARDAEIANDWLRAAMYLTAYIEREPGYLRNPSHSQEVYSHLRTDQDLIKQDLGSLQDLRKDKALIESCFDSAGKSQEFDRIVFTRVRPLGMLGPNPDQVLLFQDFDLKGGWAVKSVGEYPSIDQIGVPNDTLSSIQIGANVRVVVCRDYNFGGPCETLNGTDFNLSNNMIGDNQASSIKIMFR